MRRALLTHRFLTTSGPLRRSLPALSPAPHCTLRDRRLGLPPASGKNSGSVPSPLRHHTGGGVYLRGRSLSNYGRDRSASPNHKARKSEAKPPKPPTSPQEDDATSGNVPRRIVVRRSGTEEAIDLANLKGRVGSLIPKTSRGYQRAVLRNRARTSAAAAKATAAAAASSSAGRPPPTVPEVGPLHPLPHATKPTTCTPPSSSPFVPGAVHVPESSGGEEDGGFNNNNENNKKETLAEPPDQSSGRPKQGRARSRIRLPVVNASALLDKQAYCLQSATASTSRSGTDAAVRLHKGQRELVGAIRREIMSQQPQPQPRHQHQPPPGAAAAGTRGGGPPPPPPQATSAGGGGGGTSSSSDDAAAPGPPIRPPPYYVLQGHGVPHQLLQAHIDFADSLLRRCMASDVSFSNSALRVDFIRKRRAADNLNQVLPWSAVATTAAGGAPPRGGGGRNIEGGSQVDQPSDDEWTRNMQLYLTVMNRIANAMGLILPPPKRSSGDGTRWAPTPFVDEYDNEWTEVKAAALLPPEGDALPTQTMANGAALKHWHAEFLYGRSVPPEWVPSSELASRHPQPLVEFTPLTGMAAPGRVTVRLQGYPSSSPSSVAGTTTSSETSVSEDGSTTTITRTKPLRRRRSQPISLVFDACFRQV